MAFCLLLEVQIVLPLSYRNIVGAYMHNDEDEMVNFKPGCQFYQYAGCLSHEPCLVALAPMSLLQLSGRLTGLVTRWSLVQLIWEVLRVFLPRPVTEKKHLCQEVTPLSKIISIIYCKPTGKVYFNVKQPQRWQHFIVSNPIKAIQ